jgi:hypothetical protein
VVFFFLKQALARFANGLFAEKGISRLSDGFDDTHECPLVGLQDDTSFVQDRNLGGQGIDNPPVKRLNRRKY